MIPLFAYSIMSSNKDKNRTKLPPIHAEAKEYLQEAAEEYLDEEASRHAMKMALELDGNHPEVLTSAYRFYFYKHEFKFAFDTGERLLNLLESINHWPQQDEDRVVYFKDNEDDPMVSLYLQALNGMGVVLARLDRIDEAIHFVQRYIKLNTRWDPAAAQLLANLRSPD